MQLPLTDAGDTFARPTRSDDPYGAAARQLFRLVFLYCGLDKSLREVAGTFTALYESITDQSVAERLRACGPWVKALLGQTLALSADAPLPNGLRFVVIDASTVQAPGAKGTDHRLHIAMDLVSLEFIEVLISDVHTGETLKHFTLGPGDVALTDRGYAQAQGMHEAVQRGAALLVRLNPFSVLLSDLQGQPLSLVEALKGQRTETIRTLEVVLESADGKSQVQGWVHAYRLSAEQAGRARQKCRQRHKKGAPKSDTLYLAGWVVVFTTLAPAVALRPSWRSIAVAGKWKSRLNAGRVSDVALRAKAGSPLAEVWLHGALMQRRMRLPTRRFRLDQERVATWWRVWGMLKEEIAPMITGALFWKMEAWVACLKVLAERPRRRKLQQLPPEVIAVLYREESSQEEGRPMAA